MHFFVKDDPPSLAFVASFSGALGLVWALIAIINEARSRRRRIS
jgi:hypothetical protein